MDDLAVGEQSAGEKPHGGTTLARTGFHAIEEELRRLSLEKAGREGACVYYSKALPRVKRIIEQAHRAGIKVVHTSDESLDALVVSLPEGVRDHRGVVLLQEGGISQAQQAVDLEQWLASCPATSCVVVLDEITDPHNVGAILRSCDQFAVDLVVASKRRAADVQDSETVARSSAGASSWVKCAQVANLVNALKQLKAAGFWVWAADAKGQPLAKTEFAPRTCLVLGSEGRGIGRLLQSQCDLQVAVETAGHIDSLNVSVAAGILLHEIFIQHTAKR